MKDIAYVLETLVALMNLFEQDLQLLDMFAFDYNLIDHCIGIWYLCSSASILPESYVLNSGAFVDLITLVMNQMKITSHSLIGKKKNRSFIIF